MRRPRAAAAPPRQTIPDVRHVQDVLDQLARAQAELTARGIDLLNVAHAIGRNAVATFKHELVNSLVQDNLLRDLEQLRTALATTPLSANLRLLPEATLNWLCRHLDLSQHLQPGQELEVPAERLSQYYLQGAPPNPAKPLARLRVVAPGWKHEGHILISPRVVVAACPASPAVSEPWPAKAAVPRPLLAGRPISASFLDADANCAKFEVRMDKPTVVIDKCLLQPICVWEDKTRSRFLRFLMEHFTVYATPMLMEETAANYYSPQPGISKDLAVKMLEVISDFSWIEHPLELVYQEAVLKRSPNAGFGLNPTATSRYRGWMTDLEGHLSDLGDLFRCRCKRKQEKAADNKQFQEPLKDPTNPHALNFPDDSAFVQHVRLFLRQVLLRTELKARLVCYLCKRWDEWHGESAGRTRLALSELDPVTLGGMPFTHDYLVAHLLYLSAPVARIGLRETIKSNPLVLRGGRVNNEEDEEYVTSAVLCDYLFTCDEGMHRMAGLLNSACLLKHAGTKKRQAVLVPRAEVDRAQVDRLEGLLGPLA